MNDQIKLNFEKKRDIVDSLVEKIEKFYIFPEISDNLSKNKNMILNEIQDIDDLDEFSRKITNILQEITKDLHFYFEFNPKRANILSDEILEENSDELDAEELIVEEYENFHILKAERLPGNIGYIKINDFSPAEYAGNILIGALRFLSNSKAFIFDVRDNGGGYPSMVQLLISYLVKPSDILITNIYERHSESYFQNRVLPYVDGQRFPDVPVYILISPRTASAAEEFAYSLKMMKRATLVGETTRGAANPVDNFKISEKFIISIPVGRPINPISKDNWEGRGVEPHHTISQEDVLKVAHIMALKNLIEVESNESIRVMLKFELEFCEAMYNKIDLDLRYLEPFEGTYGTNTSILIQNEKVFFIWKNLKYELISSNNIDFFANHQIKLFFDRQDDKSILNIDWRRFGRMKLYKGLEN